MKDATLERIVRALPYFTWAGGALSGLASLALLVTGAVAWGPAGWLFCFGSCLGASIYQATYADLLDTVREYRTTIEQQQAMLREALGEEP